MAQVKIRNLQNKLQRDIDLSELVFEYPLKPHLIYEAVCHYRAEGRAGTHSTKNRSMVSGGGRKPWRQKKTGRARAGSIRSPLWRGGGTVHGPVPRSYGYAFPRKMRWNALRSALSQKVREDKLLVVEDFQLESHRTRDLLSVLTCLGLEKTKALLVDEETNRNMFLASGNLQGVTSIRAMGLSAYHVLDHDTLVASLAAVRKIQEWLGK